MLGKLIKHELKQTVRSVSTIYIILAVISAALLISSMIGLNVFKALANTALFIGTVVMAVMTLVAIIKNFSDTLYGRQGYLSFTLPVKGSSLLLSKIIVSAVWLLCAVILMVLVYIVMYISMTGENGIESLGTIKSLVDELGLAELLPSKGAIISLLLIAAMLLLMTFIVLIGFIYFSITVANTRALQSHPKLYGIIVFLGSYIAVNAISTPITQHFPLSLQVTSEKVRIAVSAMTESDAMFSYGIAGVLFKFLIAVGLLIFTGWIMEHKVNIK